MRYITAIATVLLLALSAMAQHELTPDGLFRAIEENHPLFQRTTYGPQIIEKEKAALRASEDMNLSSSFEIGHQPQTSSMSSLKNTTGVTLSGSASRMYWSTGGVLTAGAELGSSWMSYEDSPTTASLDNNSFENSIYVTYLQPLMKNYKGTLNRIPREMKDIEIDVDALQSAEEKENLLASNMDSYLYWVYYIEIDEILENRLALSRESLERNLDKRRSNLIDEVDIVRNRASVKSTELAIQSNKMQMDALLAGLARTTGVENISEMTPVFALHEMPELPPLEDILTDFSENSRTLGQLRKSIEQIEYTRLIYEEQLKDDLSAFGRAGLTEADPNFGKALLIHKPEIAIGLTWEFSREKTDIRNNLEALSLSIEQLEKQIDETELAIESSIRSIYSQLVALQGVLATIEEQYELAKEQTAEEIKLYEMGRSDYSYVIQSQDSEESIRQSYAQNALTWHRLRQNLLSLTDSMYRP